MLFERADWFVVNGVIWEFVPNRGYVNLFQLGNMEIRPNGRFYGDLFKIFNAGNEKDSFISYFTHGTSNVSF